MGRRAYKKNIMDKGDWTSGVGVATVKSVHKKIGSTGYLNLQLSRVENFTKPRRADLCVPVPHSSDSQFHETQALSCSCLLSSFNNMLGMVALSIEDMKVAAARMKEKGWQEGDGLGDRHGNWSFNVLQECFKRKFQVYFYVILIYYLI